MTFASGILASIAFGTVMLFAKDAAAPQSPRSELTEKIEIMGATITVHSIEQQLAPILHDDLIAPYESVELEQVEFDLVLLRALDGENYVREVYEHLVKDFAVLQRKNTELLGSYLL